LTITWNSFGDIEYGDIVAKVAKSSRVSLSSFDTLDLDRFDDRSTMASSWTKTMMALIGLLFILTSIPISTCFTPTRTLCNIRSSQSLPLFEKVNEVDADASSTSSENENASRQESSTTKNPLELASWYAVEAFGKVFGTKKSDGGVVESDQAITLIAINKPPSSLEETLKRIQLDNDRSYFLSGEVDGLIYDDKCTFADPFVSFDGRDRFIENLSNLGSFITNYDAKMIKFEVDNDGSEVVTKVNASSVLLVSTLKS
jgi:hypothetical protein